MYPEFVYQLEIEKSSEHYTDNFKMLAYFH